MIVARERLPNSICGYGPCGAIGGLEIKAFLDSEKNISASVSCVYCYTCWSWNRYIGADRQSIDKFKEENYVNESVNC